MLEDRRIGRLLFKLSMPAFIGMFVISMYNIVDTIFVGRYVGGLGIAGLSISFPLQMLCLGIGQLVGIGGASLISRQLGAGDRKSAELTLGNCFTIAAIFSAVIVAGGYADVDFWLRLMGASDAILPYARDYMVYILAGLVFQIYCMALNGLIRAEGNARVPMIGMIISALVNILLDAVFIIWLGMGIKGAAIATVISELLSCAYLLGYYRRGSAGVLSVRRGCLSLDRATTGRIFAIGVASFARTLSASISLVVVNNLLIRYGDETAVSAFGIIIRVMIFALMPGIVIAQGLQPILGYNYGAKRYGLALRAIWLALGSSTAFCTLVFLLAFFNPAPVFRVFTSDPEIISVGVHGARYIFFPIFMIGSIIVASMTFQALGKAVQSFLTSISRTVLFLIPLTLILPLYLDVDGVWLSFPLADILTFVFTMSLFIPQVKELKKLHAAETSN